MVNFHLSPAFHQCLVSFCVVKNFALSKDKSSLVVTLWEVICLLHRCVLVYLWWVLATPAFRVGLVTFNSPRVGAGHTKKKKKKKNPTKQLRVRFQVIKYQSTWRVRCSFMEAISYSFLKNSVHQSSHELTWVTIHTVTTWYTRRVMSWLYKKRTLEAIYLEPSWNICYVLLSLGWF